VFCLPSTHSCVPSAYTLAYPTVLTIVHLDGTSILSLYNGLMAKFYALEADVKEMAPDNGDRVMSWWIGRLTEATGATGAIGLGQFIEEISWEEGKELDIKASLAPTAWEAALVTARTKCRVIRFVDCTNRRY
jgi:hypothetical protein